MNKKKKKQVIFIFVSDAQNRQVHRHRGTKTQSPTQSGKSARVGAAREATVTVDRRGSQRSRRDDARAATNRLGVAIEDAAGREIERKSPASITANTGDIETASHQWYTHTVFILSSFFLFSFSLTNDILWFDTINLKQYSG